MCLNTFKMHIVFILGVLGSLIFLEMVLVNRGSVKIVQMVIKLFPFAQKLQMYP